MHVILVATQKVGSGKNTLCAHFGTLAERAGPTLPVDANPQGSLSFWYKRREASAPLLAKADANSIAGILDAAEGDGIEWAMVDSPPHNAPLTASLMLRATVTVILVRQGPFNLDAVAATLAMARSLEAPIACFINVAPPPTRDTEMSIVAEARALLTEMGAPGLPGQVSQRASLSHALISSQAVNEYDPEGRAAGEIAAMWSAVSELARAFPRKPESR